MSEELNNISLLDSKQKNENSFQITVYKKFDLQIIRDFFIPLGLNELLKLFFNEDPNDDPPDGTNPNSNSHKSEKNSSTTVIINQTNNYINGDSKNMQYYVIFTYYIEKKAANIDEIFKMSKTILIVGNSELDNFSHLYNFRNRTDTHQDFYTNILNDMLYQFNCKNLNNVILEEKNIFKIVNSKCEQYKIDFELLEILTASKKLNIFQLFNNKALFFKKEHEKYENYLKDIDIINRGDLDISDDGKCFYPSPFKLTRNISKSRKLNKRRKTYFNIKHKNLDNCTNTVFEN